jgi:signal transduction histidine kinase
MRVWPVKAGQTLEMNLGVMKRPDTFPAVYANALAEYASALADPSNLTRIFQTACEGFARVLTLETAAVVLYDDTAHSFQLISIYQNGKHLPVDHFPAFAPIGNEQDYVKANGPVVVRAAELLPAFGNLDPGPIEIPQVLLLAGLFHKGEKLGLLVAGAAAPQRVFPPEELVVAQASADQGAAALAHARLFLSAKKQALFLRLTNEITQIALSGGQLEQMLERLANRVVETLQAEGCYISLWDPNRKILTPYTACGPDASAFLDPSSPPAASTLDESAFNAGRPLQTWKAAPGGLAQSSVGAFLPNRPRIIILPLQIGQRKLGVIHIEHAQPHPFLSQNDWSLWEEIASQITLAITNILAIEQEKKRRQEAELLQQATIAIASSLELEEVLSQILTNLEQVVPFDSAAICLIEDECLRIAALGGSEFHSRQVGDTITHSAGLFSLLESAQAPVCLADAQEHPNYEDWSQDGQNAIHAWMGVPLIAGDNPIGYLLLNSRERDVYTPDHTRMAQAFARQAAMAIEKARLFEQVRNGRERLHALSKKLVEIQENERRFIAHELHDEIGQELTGLQFILEMAKEGPKNSRLEAVNEAQRLVTGLMSQVRELSLNLHPTMIDDLGLLPALNTHFARFQQKTGIQVHFAHQNLGWRFPAEVEVSAFRVVQEALTNTARYARVKELLVNIDADPSSLRIEVSDQGQGFDTQILQDSSRSFGISGMRERTELSGGKFELISAPGQGTQVIAVFPTGEKLERRKSDRKSHAGG